MTVAKKLDIVAFIPARSGSKGLVKEIADLYDIINYLDPAGIVSTYSQDE